MVGHMLSRTCQLTRVLHLLPKSLQSSQRYICTSNVLWKKFKYSIDKKKQVSGGGRGVKQQRKKGPTFVDGTALSYFNFDSTDEGEILREESEKQKAYSDIVRNSVEVLLTSPEAPQEIQDCRIKIVHIQVSSSLTNANVIWKLPDDCVPKYTKEQTADLLEKYIVELRSLIPAYSILTLTPSIHFVYDTVSEKQKELDALFEIVKKEEEEYMKRKLSQCESS